MLTKARGQDVEKHRGDVIPRPNIGNPNVLGAAARRKSLLYNEDILSLATGMVKSKSMPSVQSKEKAWKPRKPREHRASDRSGFMKTGGNALESVFLALDGHGSPVRSHEDGFGYDKDGNWTHERTADRVAYMKVTRRPPTYFSKVGALSLFYLDGRDPKTGDPIVDRSKQPSHVHKDKFTIEGQEKSAKWQVDIERAYRRKTGTRLENGITQFLDSYRRPQKRTERAGSEANTAGTRGARRQTPLDTAGKWSVLQPHEIDYLRHESQRKRLKTLSDKNAGGQGFVNEIRNLKRRCDNIEEKNNPCFGAKPPPPVQFSMMNFSPGKAKKIAQKPLPTPSLVYRSEELDEVEEYYFHGASRDSMAYPGMPGSRQSFQMGGSLQSFFRSKSYPKMDFPTLSGTTPTLGSEQHDPPAAQAIASTDGDGSKPLSSVADADGSAQNNGTGAIVNNNGDWPQSRASTGILLTTPSGSRRTGTAKSVSWADTTNDDGAPPPSPYVRERTISRSSNFRMITSRDNGFKGRRRRSLRCARKSRERMKSTDSMTTHAHHSEHGLKPSTPDTSDDEVPPLEFALY
jgi:hypothetical protein